MAVRSSSNGTVLLIALIALGLGCQDTGPDPVLLEEALATVEGPIKGGYIDEVDTAVVGLVRLTNWGVGACSGTLIAPNVVLTAQHCVAPITDDNNGGVDCGSSKFGPAYSASTLYITTHAEMSYSPNDYYPAAEVLIPQGGFGENWGVTNLVCGRDMALVVLSDPIDPSEATPRTPRVDTPLQDGEIYSAIGYGATGQSGNGSGVRRRRDDLEVECVADSCPAYYVTTEEWVGDAGVCQGDSGGPAVDSLERVIGVASRGGAGCGSPVYGYVQGWSDWMKQWTIYATESAGLEPPMWALGWPTDPAYSHPVGEECEAGSECPSGICKGGYCSRLCNEAAPCVAPFYCDPDDETCWLAPVGDACLGEEECPGGTCVDGYCTRSCADGVPCPDGFVCGAESQLCILPSVGGSCADGVDCINGLCIDGYCTRSCSDVLTCPENYYCAPETALCTLVPVGHPCEVAEDCFSGICSEDGYCTRMCGDDVGCPQGFYCVDSGLCELLPVGFPCESAIDCFSGICGGDGFCTRHCDEVAVCPVDYICDPSTSECALFPIGDACEEGTECPSGVCVDNQCSRPCDETTACGEGFYCLDEHGLCAPEALPDDEFELIDAATPLADRGGCSHASSAGGAGSGGVLAFLLFAFLIARRGRRIWA